MSNLKITQDQYLGEQEIGRLVKFLDTDGFRAILKAFITDYGVSLFKPDSLKVIAGTGSNITVTSGLALTENIEFINVAENQVDVLAVPGDNIPRTIVVSYKTITIEEGTVSIGADGVLVGVGTKFTEVLRGENSNTVKIRFPNSGTNTSDYSMLEINGDENAIINTAVALTPEAGQTYEVVGSFTPNQVIAPSQKLIYEYDSFELNIRTGSVLTNDIILASVQNDGILPTIIIDLRSNNLLQLIT